MAKPLFLIFCILSLACTIGLLMMGCVGCHLSSSSPVQGVVGRVIVDLGAAKKAVSLCWSPDANMMAGHLNQFANLPPDETPIHTVRIWDLAKVAEVFTSDGASDTSPCWVPDGSGIVFKTTPGGPRMQLVMASPGEPNAQPITNAYQSLATGCDNVWIDADTMVFFERNQGEAFRIKTWNRKTNAVREFWNTTGQSAVMPTMSPSGNHLAYFNQSEDPRRLMIVALKEKKVLFTPSSRVGRPSDLAWTNRSDRLVYISRSDMGAELHRVDVDSGVDKVIATAKDFVSSIAIREANNDIAIATIESSDSSPRMHIYNIDGNLIAKSPDSIEVAAPAWSPDGSDFAYSASAHKPVFYRIYIADADAIMKEWKP